MVERAGPCRRDSRAARPPGPRTAVNALGRPLVRGVAASLAGLLVAGCSLSFPVDGVGVDTSATGSIDRTAAFLSPALDGEDLRRAKAAMAVALDPQGNGARAGWQNPQTGARGAFAAARPPYPDHDRVCRAFTGEVAPAGGAERRLSGTACRESDGSWLLQSGA